MSQLLINGQTIQQYFQQHGTGNLLLQRPQQIQTSQNPQFIITRPVSQSPQIIQQQQIQPPTQQIQQSIGVQQPQHAQMFSTSTTTEDQKIMQKKKVWLLVELESHKEGNIYGVVEAKDVVGQSETGGLHTGKVVTIYYNNKQRRASIVMVSEDKNFIYTELHTLNKLSEDNLRAKDQQNKKRRRLSDAENIRKLPEDDSSSSAWSSISQTNQEKELMPSTHIYQRKQIKSPTDIPPMTFDQQTQTDSRYTGSANNSNVNSDDIVKLLALNQQLLISHSEMKADSELSRASLANFSVEMTAIRRTLENISNKLEHIENQNQNRHFAQEKLMMNTKKEDKGYYVIAQEVNSKHPNEADMNATANESSYIEETTEFTIEEVNTDNSGRASNSSRFSYHDHDNSTMMSTGSQQNGDEERSSFGRSQSMLSIGSSSGNSSTPIQRKQQKKEKNRALLTQIQKDWNCEGGDENADKMIVIGSNKTAIPTHILRSIDWDNYRQATRKLLVTLFSRETLATHSLTGKPSPAFHDQNKPVKDGLDPGIIADIVHIVSKYCGVSESQVRTAITTKCADENKMYKQRKQQEKKLQFKQPNSSNIPNTETMENKENIVNR